MAVLGVLLIVLAAPLLIGYFVAEKKNKGWRNLGIVMLGLGILIALIPS